MNLIVFTHNTIFNLLTAFWME